MPNRKILHSCPFCGSEVEFYGNRVLDGKTHDVYICTNRSCKAITYTKNCEKKAKTQWTDISFDIGDFKSRDGETYELSITSAKCSNCERYSAVLQQIRPKPTQYCPYCGAEMEVNK